MKLDLSIGEKKVTNHIVDIYMGKYYSIYPHITTRSYRLMLSLLSSMFPWISRLKFSFCFTLGNRDGIYTSFYVLNNNKRKYVIIFKPYYKIYKEVSLSFNKSIILICSNNIVNAFKYYIYILPYVNVIFICNPNNFNGCFISSSDINVILYYASRFNIGVISDECYFELCSSVGISSPFYLNRYYNNNSFIYVNSLSKRSCLPGLRSGILISSKYIISRISSYRIISGTQLSCINQAFSLKAWLNSKHVYYLKRKYNSLLALSLDILKSNGIKAKGGIFYIGIRLPVSSFKVSCFISHMYSIYNVILSNGKLFGLRGYVRIALITKRNYCISVIKNIVDLINGRKKD
ncbi:aminotransferase class I/II-fold pyridoxal phosphate-dependent enzyme [Candidatus Vidania fulgoroideorum]